MLGDGAKRMRMGCRSSMKRPYFVAENNTSSHLDIKNFLFSIDRRSGFPAGAENGKSKVLFRGESS